MKIQFGSSNCGCPRLIFGIGALAALVINFYLLGVFGKCAKLVVDVRMSNLTLSIKDMFSCAPFLSECLCSISLNGTESSNNCITDKERACSRILSLISFKLQICRIREFFTLHDDWSRRLVYSMWIASFFNFVGLTIAIYCNDFYHRYRILILYCMCAILGTLATHDMVADKRHEPVSHNGSVLVCI